VTGAEEPIREGEKKEVLRTISNAKRKKKNPGKSRSILATNVTGVWGENAKKKGGEVHAAIGGEKKGN